MGGVARYGRWTKKNGGAKPEGEDLPSPACKRTESACVARRVALRVCGEGEDSSGPEEKEEQEGWRVGKGEKRKNVRACVRARARGSVRERREEWKKEKRKERRRRRRRKDVKQSNDEMHFPLYAVPGSRPEGNVERNVKNWEEE